MNRRADDDDAYIMRCIYGRSLKNMFESIGKITLDRMVFFMVFRENEMRLSVKDASGLFNSIVVKDELFEECHIKRANSNDGGYIAILDIKDFNSMQKFLTLDSLLTIRYNQEKGKVYFCCEEENDKYKEVRSLKLKEIKKTQTQFNLNASLPDEEDRIGELKFNANGASAFKACIEKTFSSKHKYLLFHFNTEKSTLMITNDEIKEGEIEQYDFVCHIFSMDSVKGHFRSSSDFKFYYSYKLLHYVAGFLIKDCSISLKVYSSGALCFGNNWGPNIEVSTIMPASNSEND